MLLKSLALCLAKAKTKEEALCYSVQAITAESFIS